MTQSFLEFFCLHRKNLILNLVARNFKVKYRGSIFGYLWTLLIPISQVLVFYFVYQVVLKVPVPNYLAFIVVGIMPWVFFSSTVNEGFDMLVAGQGLLTHIPMPIQGFSAAAVLTNFASFMIAVPIILAVILFSGLPLTWQMLWFFPLSALLFLFTYSLSFIFACLFVYFRDLKYLFSILVQVWLYVTPILYSATMIPQKYEWVIKVNPLSGYFMNLHNVLLQNAPMDWSSAGLFGAWAFATALIANYMRVYVAPYLVEKL